MILMMLNPPRDTHVAFGSRRPSAPSGTDCVNLMHHVDRIYLNNALWLKFAARLHILTTPLRPKAVVFVTHSRGNRKVRVIISHRSGSSDPCGSGGTPGQGSKHKKVIRGKFVLDRKTVPRTKTAGGRACRWCLQYPVFFRGRDVRLPRSTVSNALL